MNNFYTPRSPALHPASYPPAPHFSAPPHPDPFDDSDAYAAEAADAWNWDQPRTVPVPVPGTYASRPLGSPLQYQEKSASKKKKGSKKAEGKQPTFLTKLYQLLADEATQHIIRWDESGENIIIENPEELAVKILPVVYRQSRFASFSRQLNIYGFNRKLSLRNVERGICDPDASTWSHTNLTRDSSPQEILQFKRRVPPRPSQSAKRNLLAQLGPAHQPSGTGYQQHQHQQGLPIPAGSSGYNPAYGGMGGYPAFPGSAEEGASPTSSESMSVGRGGGERGSGEGGREWHSPPDAYQLNLLPDVVEEPPASAVYPGKNYFGFNTQGGYGVPRAYEGWKQELGYGSGHGHGHGMGLGLGLGQGEGVSPGLSFDYGTPPERDYHNSHLAESPKHIVIPRIHPSLPLPRQPLGPHYASLHKSPPTTNLVPQSAPADAGGFSIPIPIKVQQQHQRTRSVQGEPPSAMMFSPLGEGGWGDVPEPAQHQHQHIPGQGQGQMNPPLSAPIPTPTPIPAGQYNPLDPENWVRRGMVDISQAGGSVTPVPFDSGPVNKAGSSPASLPSSMGGYVARSTSLGHQHRHSGGMGVMGGQSLGSGFGGD
ncbi:hypothetical protein IAR50_001462 [Cryptococcus sp. DSM 104548]